MKPIPLLAYPIKNSSAPNGVVMGSVRRQRFHADCLRAD